MSGEYYFDEFFVPEDDAGHEVTVKIRGRDIPISVSRGLSLADREAAKSRSVRSRINPKNGQLEVLGVDEQAFQTELLMRAIRSWPFKFRDGSPVPITRENINRMLSDAVDILIQEVLGLLDKEKSALGPFEMQSGEDS